MVPLYHPSSPTPRPEGVVEALASSPPLTRRRRLNSRSSGTGQLTGIAGWRRAPVSRAGSRSSTLGMGMQSTPAKRSKSIDTIPWDSNASQRTDQQSREHGTDDRDTGAEGRSSDTPQRPADRRVTMSQWQDPLETTSEASREIYEDLEVPLRFGSSASSPPGGNKASDEEHSTPRKRKTPSISASLASSPSHYDIIAPLNDEHTRTPTSAERITSSRIASRQLTPRPRLDLPPSDPPWSSTPSVLRDEPSPRYGCRDYRSSSSPEILRRRYSSMTAWDLPIRATPPSPLQFGFQPYHDLGSDFEYPSSVPLVGREYNLEREERALQPDPFGFSRLPAIIRGRQPQVYLPSSQVDYPARANTPVDLSSPATSPEQSPISPDGALSVRQSSPALGQSYSPPKKKQYWLGERIYRRMERGSTSETDGSDDGKLSVRQSKKNNGKKRKSLSAKRATPEPDQAAVDARDARIAHFKELDEHYNLTVEYVWN